MKKGKTIVYVPAAILIVILLLIGIYDLNEATLASPSSCVRGAHAPMGLADLGVDTGTHASYSYSSSKVSAEVAYQSFGTFNKALGWMNDSRASFQLNAVLVFSHASTTYVYWVQDVAEFSSNVYELSYLDNIWNLSAPAAQMYNSTVTWSQLGSAGIGAWHGTHYYWHNASSQLLGSDEFLVPPSVFYLEMDVGIEGNLPTLAFRYANPFTEGQVVTYDTVSFRFAVGSNNLHGFVVDGGIQTPNHMYYDLEIVVGGPGAGNQTGIQFGEVQFRLFHWNGHNWEAPPSTYNYGCDTAEGVYNATVVGGFDPNGTPFGQLTGATDGNWGNPGGVYSQGDMANLTFVDPAVNGDLEGHLFTHLSDGRDILHWPKPDSGNTSFVDGSASILISPGTYWVYDSIGNGTLHDLGVCTLQAGQTLQIEASVGCPIQFTS